MTRKIAFVDRDGTLIREPADQQVDSLDKLRLVEGVIPALLALAAQGYRFVIVTNQDGLGTAGYPRERYELVNAAMLDLFASQGVTFDEVLVCPHMAAESCACRKPHLGLVRSYLSAGDLDLARSLVVGDRASDMMLAENMGLRGFRVGDGGSAWRDIVRSISAEPRRGREQRRTQETQVTVEVDLDDHSPSRIHTGIGFFDHMLAQLAKHGGFGLALAVTGDLNVDEHHSVEDAALALGCALRRALGDKVGIERYGFWLPMDEADAAATLDLSGRPYFVLDGTFPREQVGGLHTEMVSHFFRSLCEAMGAGLHLRVRGENTHHMVEASFKAVGRALCAAVRQTGNGLPSTKGVL